MKPARSGVMAIVITAAMVAACASGIAPAPSGTIAPSSPESTIAPTGTPAPPLSLTSVEIGALQMPFGLGGVLAFDRGYVTWGVIEESGTFATWYSTDGASWRQTVQSTPIVSCPGYSPRSNLSDVYAGAPVAGTVVLLGSLAVPDGIECDRHKVVALATADGTTWHRSPPFGPPDTTQVWAHAVWAAPGGLEALVGQSELDRWTIWRSPGGLAWTQVGSIEAAAEMQSWHVYGAGPDGTRLGFRSDPDGPGAVVASTDGTTWMEVGGIPAGFQIVDVLPPPGSGGRWIVSMVREDPEEARVLSSVDLVTWEAVTFPRLGIESLIATPDGFAAIGLSPQREVGCNDTCRPEDMALYTSANGVIWTKQFGIASPEARVVDGPGGMLLFESRVDGDVAVLRVEPD